MERKIDSQILYDGKVIKVFKDTVFIDENQTTAIREVVRHNGGAAIVAMHNHKILLVKQFRYVLNDFTLELPAGKIEIDEEPLLCASREIEEETGYRAKQLDKILEVIPTPGYCDEKLHLFYTNQLIKVENPRSCDDDEFIEMIEMDINEAYQSVKQGKIIDAKTVIGILYAKIEAEV